MEHQSPCKAMRTCVSLGSLYVGAQEGVAAVQVNVTTDPDMGTIYSVAVPIKRVKPTARVPMGGERGLPLQITRCYRLYREVCSSIST